MMSQQLFVNQTQAAKMLGVTTRTIYAWETQKLITRSGHFKSARYSVEQLKKLTLQDNQGTAE